MKNSEKIKCPCGCNEILTDETIRILAYLDRKLQSELRTELILNSGARCPAYNKSINGHWNSAHLLNFACDISTTTSQIRFCILEGLFTLGIERIGWNRDKKFIHFDRATAQTALPDGTGFYPTSVAFDY